MAPKKRTLDLLRHVRRADGVVFRQLWGRHARRTEAR